MEIINDKLTKCESYISRQKQYLLAMDSMSRDYIRDHAMVAQCHQEIADINRNIEFLNNQLNYLKTEKTILVREQAQDGTLPDSAYLEQVNVMGNSLTLRKLTDESLTIDRITFKIQEIEYKRNIDIRLKDGFDKLLKILSIGKESNDRKDLIEAKKNVENCQHRISLFDRALKRYININDINNLEYKQSHLIWKNPASRRPMTGNLSVKIQSAKNLFRLNNDELYVSVRVDGFTKQQTKPTKTDRWLEEFEMMVEKANELELIVYGTRSGNNPVPIGIFWIPIREIAEAVRTGAFNQGGWMNYNDTMKSEQGINIQQNIDNGNFVESWFTLEPIGQLELKLGFTKANRPLRTHSKLGRQGAVKKKKEQIIQHNGHNFVIKQFYNIMTCALCNEFLMRGSGFQCEDCGFFCHKKCGPQVLFKCISKTSGEVDAETINHHIPHRFEFTTNLSPNWCCHCGHLLPLGKKACKRCKSCSTMAHNECFHLVPDLCGLSMKEANGILTAIRRVKQDISNKSDHTIKGKSDSAIDQLAQGVNSLSTEARKTVIEDFHFLAVLGRGNFGKVMLSEEKSTKNLFAIKVLKKDLIIQSHDLDSLRAERRVFMTANKDHHPFLLGLHSCFQSPTRIYFVMEYIQGGDLMYHIQQQPFSVQQTKFYAIEVLLGLEHLHRNNIVYRDLKLDNILLDLDGHIRIADFGLCKEEMGYGSITHTFCGTPEFLAPEILLEQGYGRAVDWWAYGVLLYEMRLGSEPFKGSEEDEIYDAILEDEVLYPYNLERETVSILQKLLTRDPNYRLGGGPEDAQEVKRHIYFKGVVWDDYLNLKIPPPYKPTIRKKDDISNFESTFTNEQPVLTPTDSILSPQDQNEFSGFSYTANWAGERRN